MGEQTECATWDAIERAYASQARATPSGFQFARSCNERHYGHCSGMPNGDAAQKDRNARFDSFQRFLNRHARQMPDNDFKYFDVCFFIQPTLKLCSVYLMVDGLGGSSQWQSYVPLVNIFDVNPFVRRFHSCLLLKHICWHAGSHIRLIHTRVVSLYSPYTDLGYLARW